jgi:hypothetical protein
MQLAPTAPVIVYGYDSEKRMTSTQTAGNTRGNGVRGNGVRVQLADKKFSFMSSFHRLAPESVSALLAPS